MRKNRSYTIEFKRKIVQEIITGQKSLAQICREHSISSSTVSTWVKKYKNGHNLQQPNNQSKEKAMNKRIAQLEQLLGQQTLEITLLKKARELSEQKLREESFNRPIPGAQL